MAGKADHRHDELSDLRGPDLLCRSAGVIGRDALLPWSRRKAMLVLLTISAIGWGVVAILLR